MTFADENRLLINITINFWYIGKGENYKTTKIFISIEILKDSNNKIFQNVNYFSNESSMLKELPYIVYKWIYGDYISYKNDYLNVSPVRSLKYR